MAAFRLSRLQKRVLRWLLAEEKRLGPMVSSSHQSLVVLYPMPKAISVTAYVGWKRNNSSWWGARGLGVLRTFSTSHPKAVKKPPKSGKSYE